ncbi:LysR substrate-binding domain-containing protein [Pseudoduganella ginsengisoli]|uniref:LysR substrate-binding domain-containing protein n=1 Tax=Pseudoduganella ginsengisoli TaxID=1462440 RepID=UPI00353070B0
MARAGPAALAPSSASDMAEVLKAFALAGQGLAWLAASCIDRELAEGRLVRAGGPAWCLPMEILAVRKRASGAAQALWEAQQNL